MRIYIPSRNEGVGLQGKDGLGKSLILKPFKWSERVRAVTNNIKVTGNVGFHFFSSTFYLLWQPWKTLSFILFFLKGGVEKREKSMVSLHCQEYQWNYSIVVMKLGFLGMTVKFLLGGSVQDGFSFDMNISTKPWNHEDYLLNDSAYLDSAGR